MIKPFFLITILLFSPMFIAALQPQHNHSHEHPAHAHLHGSAQLSLVLEGSELEISFESPAVNIVGFEHKANSEKHMKAVDKARANLQAPNLFLFSGSDCSLKEAEVDMSSIIEHDSQHSDDKDYEGHSEISANYSYSCLKGEKLKTVSVNLISLFPAIETLEVIWLTSDQQSTTKLTSQSNIIRIR